MYTDWTAVALLLLTASSASAALQVQQQQGRWRVPPSWSLMRCRRWLHQPGQLQSLLVPKRLNCRPENLSHTSRSL